jgi:hypothetical protein
MREASKGSMPLRNIIAAKKHKRRKIPRADLASNLQFHFHPAGTISQITGRNQCF